jgi:hypothetical protein
MADTNEVTFVIEGKGKKEDDKSLTGITFTKIKIGDSELQEITGDSGPEHENAKKVLSELLSQSTVKPNETTGDQSGDQSGDLSDKIDGGSSHRRKSYKKEKKIKGGKRKSMRRNKHV